MGNRDRRAVNGVRRTPAPSGDTTDADPGCFVVLEGIDGSGKSVQARMLAKRLEPLEAGVVLTREPTDGLWGRRYRSWARGETEASSDEVLTFFLEDRAEHVERVIRPALGRGDVVVCDRYVDSTRAYQAAHGVDRHALEERIRERLFPEPGLVLWLRVPVTAALDRIEEAATERYERRAFLERVDREYARLGLHEIDGSATPEKVGDGIGRVVEALLRDRGIIPR
ncbi:MAG: dTMP kinase [Myxococcota bacterium]